jgi:integrase
VAPVLARIAVGWRPLFATAIYTGLRKGELLGLRKGELLGLRKGELLGLRKKDVDGFTALRGPSRCA